MQLLRGYLLWARAINAPALFGGVTARSAGPPGIDTPGGRRNVSLVGYDDESSQSQCALAYEQLAANDSVDYLLGPFGSRWAPPCTTTCSSS